MVGIAGMFCGGGHWTLGIGNGVGKQGRGNQPPYRRYGPDTEIQYRPRKPHGLAKPSRILTKREADTEFQYRPHIVDTDIDCGRHFCRRHFRDSYGLRRARCSEEPNLPSHAAAVSGFVPSNAHSARRRHCKWCKTIFLSCA